jgi:hypothetical protein
MHNQLEEYLNTVSGCLSELPASHREEEVREIRQHLANYVMLNQEFGQSEDVAVANAIEQFGSPVEVGGSVLGAWKRGARIKRIKTFAGMTILLATSFGIDMYLSPGHIWTDCAFLMIWLVASGPMLLSSDGTAGKPGSASWPYQSHRASKKSALPLLPWWLVAVSGPLFLDEAVWQHTRPHAATVLSAMFCYGAVLYGLWLRGQNTCRRSRV